MEQCECQDRQKREDPRNTGKSDEVERSDTSDAGPTGMQFFPVASQDCIPGEREDALEEPHTATQSAGYLIATGLQPHFNLQPISCLPVTELVSVGVGVPAPRFPFQPKSSRGFQPQTLARVWPLLTESQCARDNGLRQCQPARAPGRFVVVNPRARELCS
jgi:hypothetical protein